jgi:ferric iron reductase protein FhuF
MKKYTLEVIMNVSQKLKEYEVIADYFEWSNSGCYVFYTSNEHRNKIISSYPISRTIIKQIEDVND